MGLCSKCRKVYPPHFLEKKNGVDLCLWCNREVDFIMYTDENGMKKKATKEEISKEYQIFLKQLKESKDVNKILKKGEQKNE